MITIFYIRLDRLLVNFKIYSTVNKHSPLQLFHIAWNVHVVYIVSVCENQERQQKSQEIGTAWLRNCTQAEIPAAATGPNYAAFGSEEVQVWRMFYLLCFETIINGATLVVVCGHHSRSSKPRLKKVLWVPLATVFTKSWSGNDEWDERDDHEGGAGVHQEVEAGAGGDAQEEGCRWGGEDLR